MRTVIVFAGVLLVLICCGPAVSEDLESLAKEGYQVVEETRVAGEFKGCDARTALTFTNGKVFICSSYAYSFSVYMPAVFILKKQGNEIKVLINGIAYSGSFLEHEK